MLTFLWLCASILLLTARASCAAGRPAALPNRKGPAGGADGPARTNPRERRRRHATAGGGTPRRRHAGPRGAGAALSCRRRGRGPPCGAGPAAAAVNQSPDNGAPFHRAAGRQTSAGRRAPAPSAEVRRARRGGAFGPRAPRPPRRPARGPPCGPLVLASRRAPGRDASPRQFPLALRPVARAAGGSHCYRKGSGRFRRRGAERRRTRERTRGRAVAARARACERACSARAAFCCISCPLSRITSRHLSAMDVSSRRARSRSARRPSCGRCGAGRSEHGRGQRTLELCTERSEERG